MPNRKNKVEPDEQGYYPAVAAADVLAGQITVATISGEVVIITQLNGEYHAFSAVCPHGAGDLTKGDLYRGRIDCPDHGYRFDIKSGRPLWPEDEFCRLRRFPLKLVDGQLYLKLAG